MFSLPTTIQTRLFLRYSMSIGALALNVGCSASDPAAPQDATSRSASVTYCEVPFAASSAHSPEAIVHASVDSTSRTVTLKSSEKYGYSEGTYNLSDGCYSRKDQACAVHDQMHFNHGGEPTHWSISGNMMQLRDEDASKFDSIALANIDSLDLKSIDGKAIERSAIFRTTKRNPYYSSSEKLKPGRVVLALLNDPFYSGKYQFFKMKVVDIQGGERITFTYQRLAEANDGDLRNFVCSRRAALLSAGPKGSGEKTILAREYSGDDSFDFETALSGDDQHFAGLSGDGQLNFSDIDFESKQTSATVNVKNDDQSFGRITVFGEKPLSEVDRSSWQPLDQIGQLPSGQTVNENVTYLVSHFNGTRFLYAAIRILKIDMKGVRFQWKRVASEPAVRFMNFVAQPLTPVATLETATMNAERSTHLEFSEAQLRNRDSGIRFDAKTDTLVVEARIFPNYAGIVDVTSNYVSLDVIPVSVDANFLGSFKASEPIRMGARYVVATETFKKRSILALEVVGFVPGKSVTVRYKQIADYSSKPIESSRR